MSLGIWTWIKRIWKIYKDLEICHKGRKAERNTRQGDCEIDNAGGKVKYHSQDASDGSEINTDLEICHKGRKVERNTKGKK